MSACFIRRSGYWTAARPHHERALRLYMIHMREERGQEEEGEEGEEEPGEEHPMIPNGDAMIISVPHTDGGTFVASFSHIEDDLYQFVDAYRNTVQIMMSDHGRVALINRLTD
jgi:hypothetical protein